MGQHWEDRDDHAKEMFVAYINGEAPSPRRARELSDVFWIALGIVILVAHIAGLVAIHT